MKSLRFLSLLSLATLSCIPILLPAVEAVKFEAVLYLFRSSSIGKIDFSKALHGPIPISGESIVVSPPATIVFDGQEVLALNGEGYTWNGGQVVPARFSETKLPVMETRAGQSVTIRIDVPIQFLEKMSDGSLQVREIPRNSTAAPRYQLTLSAQPAAEAPQGYDLKVTCQMDISTVQGREKIPGVDLEVGRPVISRFDRKIEYWGRKGEWFGIMVGQKESGDFTLQILLKVSSAGEPPAS